MGRVPDLGHVAGGEAAIRTCRTRTTRSFERVAKELAKAVEDAGLRVDGEVLRARRGRPAELLRDAAGQARYADRCIVVDLLEVDGEARCSPARGGERRARLEKLLDRRNRTVRLSEFFDDGVALYRAAKEQGLEGIVAKRVGSLTYAVGKRTRDWLKIKAKGDQELVIAGYTKGQGRRAWESFGSLVVVSTGAGKNWSTPETRVPGSTTGRSTSW